MQDNLFFDHKIDRDKKKDNRPFSESLSAKKSVAQTTTTDSEVEVKATDTKDKGIDTKKSSKVAKNTEKAKSILSNIYTRLKKIKHIEFYIAGIAIAIMLLIYFSANIFGGTKTNADESQNITYDNYIVQQENKVTSMVRQMKGVGKADVAIRFESSIEYILAVITTESSNGTSTTPILVTENGVTKPIIVQEIYPKAKGVVVVCEGAKDAKVKLQVIDAVSIMLDLVKEKIVVTPM